MDKQQLAEGQTSKTGFIAYEASDGIATITLDRPQAANAQTLDMLDDLDAAWRTAAEDPGVRVIILQANGKHFSYAHGMLGKAESAVQSERVAFVFIPALKLWLEHAELTRWLASAADVLPWLRGVSASVGVDAWLERALRQLRQLLSLRERSQQAAGR